MAKDPASDLTYVLEIEAQHVDMLGQIRHWPQLMIAGEAGIYWVKELTQRQIDTVEIKTIPFKKIFYLRDNRLFPYGSQLPVKKLPSALLWTPLVRALSVSLPGFNHNYFGIGSTLEIGLIPSEKEQEVLGLRTPLDILAAYIESVPAIRLKNLQWVIREESAIILGTPLLPLPGETYWRKGCFLLPAGYDFEFPALADTLEKQINPEKMDWLVWQKDARYFSISKYLFQPLSISSVRRSIPPMTLMPSDNNSSL